MQMMTDAMAYESDLDRAIGGPAFEDLVRGRCPAAGPCNLRKDGSTDE